MRWLTQSQTRENVINSFTHWCRYYVIVPIPAHQSAGSNTGWYGSYGNFPGYIVSVDICRPNWGSLISIGMLGFSHYSNMNDILSQAFGAPVTVQVLFMLIMSGGLAYYKISAYMGRFFLTRKFTNGKPWLFLGVLCIGCYFIAGFINAFTPIFVLWPVLYGIFDEVGYKKGDAFPRVALTMIVIGSLIGFPMAPFAQNGLALLSNFEKITSEMPGGPIVVNSGAYLAAAIVLGMIMVTAAILFCKYVLRPDVSKMKNFDVESFSKNPMPPMSLQQKLYCTGFVCVILGLMLPSLVPNPSGSVCIKTGSLRHCNDHGSDYGGYPR